MTTGTVLFLTVLLSLILGIIGFISLKNGHKKQKESYSKLWKEFHHLKNEEFLAKSKELVELGNQLVFNKYIPTDHLVIIQEYAKEMEFRFPEFEELRLNAYDKWIYHTQGHGRTF